MAYARKTKKTTRRPAKRSAGVRKRTTKRRLGVFRPQRLLRVGFPKTTAVKLRYVDGVSLNPVTSTLATYAFSANSCFDPNVTGIGHQPMNFDMWSALYNHYVVVGSKIRVTFNFGTTAQADGFVCGCFVSDDLSYTTDPTTMMEQGLARYKIRNANAFKPGAPTVTCGYSAKKYFNLTNVMDNVLRVGAGINNNPADTANFIIFCGPTPASTVDLTAIMCTVIIDYIVIFSEPKEQPLS